MEELIAYTAESWKPIFNGFFIAYQSKPGVAFTLSVRGQPPLGGSVATMQVKELPLKLASARGDASKEGRCMELPVDGIFAETAAQAVTVRPIMLYEDLTTTLRINGFGEIYEFRPTAHTTVISALQLTPLLDPFDLTTWRCASPIDEAVFFLRLRWVWVGLQEGQVAEPDPDQRFLLAKLNDAWKFARMNPPIIAPSSVLDMVRARLWRLRTKKNYSFNQHSAALLLAADACAGNLLAIARLTEKDLEAKMLPAPSTSAK